MTRDVSQGTTPYNALTLHQRHLDILLAVWRWKYLSIQELVRLLGMKSLPHMRQLVGELCGRQDYCPREYLVRLPIPNTRIGGVEKAYHLGSRGREVLARELGVPVEGSSRPARPSKIAQVSTGHLLHDLAVNRFLVALLTWAKTRRDIRLSDEQIRTQYELAKEPLLAKASQMGAAGETSPRVVPDAWVNVEVVKEGAATESVPLWIEIDRGTTYAPALKARLRSRLNFIRPGGPYATLFGTDAVTIVYLTTAGERRRDSLACYAAEVLAAERREDWAELLLFGAASFEKMYEEAHALCTQHLWRRADGGEVRLFG